MLQWSPCVDDSDVCRVFCDDRPVSTCHCFCCCCCSSLSAGLCVCRLHSLALQTLSWHSRLDVRALVSQSVSQSVSMLFYWHIDGNSLTLNCRMLFRLATLVYFFDKLHHCDNCFIKKMLCVLNWPVLFWFRLFVVILRLFSFCLLNLSIYFVLGCHIRWWNKAVHNVSWICREWTTKTVNCCNYSYFV